mgnify:FL=1
MAVIGLGFVGGAALRLKGDLIGVLFGRSSFASAFGLLQTVGVPFQLLLVPLGGYIRDVTGDYAAVFGATIPLFGIATVLLFFEKPTASR